MHAGWKEEDFSDFDVVLHTAGIVSAETMEQMREVNVRLTKEVAEKAFRDGVKQFVFLSSMAVYDGIEWGFGKTGLITENTIPVQSTAYGASKYEAEKAISSLDSGNTKVAIVRAPSIVGKGMEGYFDRYVKFANIPLVPIPWIHIEAKRSFIYASTLAEFILNLIGECREGVFFPQQLPQMSVSEMMEAVCEAIGVAKRRSDVLGKMLPYSIQRRFFSQISYDPALSHDENIEASNINSCEAIRETVK